MDIRSSHTSMNATIGASTMLSSTQTLPHRGLGSTSAALPVSPSPAGSPYPGNTGLLSPFSGPASLGRATSPSGFAAYPSPHQALSAPSDLGTDILACRRRADVLPRIAGALVSSGFMCSTIRTDADDKICLGRVLRFTRAESDALPLEAGGTASRQDMPLVNPDTIAMLERRPATLDDVRSTIFPTSHGASGDRPLSPDASDLPPSESKAPPAAPPAPSRPTPSTPPGIPKSPRCSSACRSTRRTCAAPQGPGR